MEYKYNFSAVTNNFVKMKEKATIKSKCVNIHFTNNKLIFNFYAYIVAKNCNVSKVELHINEKIFKEIKLKTFNKGLNKYKIFINNRLQTVKFDLLDIINDEISINNSIYFELHLENGKKIKKFFTSKNKIIEKKSNYKMYYLPWDSKYIGNYSVLIRRTAKGNLLLTKRLKENIEFNKKFNFFESKLISGCMYYMSKLFSKFKSINIFYEKFASKAEEGTFEICKKCQESKKSKNYYIIDKSSEDYNKIKNNKFVVQKYSFKYYWLIFRAKHIIATEAPMHINVLRSSNYYLRKSIYNKKNVFLQHGIIYLKNMEASSFSKNREAEPTYILASSDKEKEIIKSSLKLNEDQILVTGIPMYNNLKYKHINNNSKDIVTIMLTWKSYEEHLKDFKKSSYYKNVQEIYNILIKYINKDNINIVAHPKVNELLSSTGMKIWDKPISEVLEKTKLIITDYSSVCYNSFYQGSAVIFYQPDLELYEEVNGKLIPNDDEYIGKRVFNINQIEDLFKDTISNNKIKLNKLRTKTNENMYKTINEFTDGKNIDRIYNELQRVNII